MKVFVGTMESGENDYQKCVAAIKQQKNVQFEHYVISGLEEFEAHRALFAHWNAVKHDHDLFLKIDADTVLAHDYVIESFVKLFMNNPSLTGTQAWLHDYMTDDLIFGLGCFKSCVNIIEPSSKLYCDRVDSGHQLVLRGNDLPKELIPAGFHCHHASNKQAFHYGVHRAKKKQTSVHQKLLYAWHKHRDERRAYALMGFAYANKCSAFDYGLAQFENLYTQAQQEYDRFVEKLIRVR